jgi:hypothetical protein
MSVLDSYSNILCRALKPRESKRLQAKGQWSISALGGGLDSLAALSPLVFVAMTIIGSTLTLLLPVRPFAIEFS